MAGAGAWHNEVLTHHIADRNNSVNQHGIHDRPQIGPVLSIAIFINEDANHRVGSRSLDNESINATLAKMKRLIIVCITHSNFSIAL